MNYEKKMNAYMSNGHVPFSNGLANKGNTCFVSSVLISLFHVTPFAAKYGEKQVSGMLQLSERPGDFLAHKIFGQLVDLAFRNLAADEKLEELLKIIFSQNRFNAGEQDCARLFFESFLELLDVENKEECPVLQAQPHLAAAVSALDQFILLQKTKFTCTASHSIRETSPVMLTVFQRSSDKELTHCLERYFARQQLPVCTCSIDSRRCSARLCVDCDAHTFKTERSSIAVAPEILIISIQLFDNTLKGPSGPGLFLNSRLNLYKMMASGSDKRASYVYSLRAVVLRHGLTDTQSGHYTTVCKNLADESEWRHYDDSQVETLNPFASVSDSIHKIGARPYLLFFEREHREKIIDRTGWITLAQLKKSMTAVETLTGKPQQKKGEVVVEGGAKRAAATAGLDDTDGDGNDVPSTTAASGGAKRSKQLSIDNCSGGGEARRRRRRAMLLSSSSCESIPNAQEKPQPQPTLVVIDDNDDDDEEDEGDVSSMSLVTLSQSLMLLTPAP